VKIGGNYFLGMWTAAKPGLWNWLASIGKSDDGTWEVETRLRLEIDDKVFDSKDPKYWEDYRVSAEVPEDEVISTIEEMREHKIKFLCSFHQATFNEDISGEILKETVLIRSSVSEVIMAKMGELDFLNVMPIPVPEGGPNCN
jgi:hypothetical protein